ncbi:hypothetical protein CBM2623_B170436 [Cupriavidus taiwanensis]|nr:hypothetical protein CBM2608_B140504 [Cupriavidus taiwanensis]SPA33392.1 hypothetical protein CBM2623_B170436 [Cupriavidus taiwanensis]
MSEFPCPQPGFTVVFFSAFQSKVMSRTSILPRYECFRGEIPKWAMNQGCPSINHWS